MTDCMLLITAFIAVFTDSDIMTFSAVIWSDENRLKLVMFVNECNVRLSESDIFNLDSDLDIFIMNDKEADRTCNLIKIEKSEEKKEVCNDSSLS